MHGLNETWMPVIFRIYRGELCAYFPSECATRGNASMITCYAHVGQHGAACTTWLQRGRIATEAEYANLLRELNGIYEEAPNPIRLEVRKRDNRAFQEARRRQAMRRITA